MGVSPASKSVTRLVPTALGGAAAALLLAAPASAADPWTATVGPPTPLFSPASPSAAPTPSPPTRSAAVASPGRHPAVPVQRIPLDAKPLIPPAILPAKLGPPLEPRPALSLETDIEPLAPAAPASPQPDAAPPPLTSKPPPS